MPAILDPHRPRLEGELDADTRLQQARDLDKALEQAADYGQYLWRQLRGVRQHLLDMLPLPDAEDPATRTLTAPRGAADDEGWERWQFAYEMVTSTLAGPHGDEGFGRHEAAMAALERRGPRHYSAETAELVDLATERSARAEEQLSAPDLSAGDSTEEPALASGPPSDAAHLRPIPAAIVAVVFAAGLAAGALLAGRPRPA